MQKILRDDSGCQRSEEIGRRASVTSSRASAFLRWLPLVAGAIAFELTASAMLGVALACFRFGEKDFSTALWLRRVDPVLSRGRAVAWFLLAMGLGKVAVSGVLGVTIAAMTMELLGRFPGGPVAVLIGQANGAVLTVIGAGLGFLVATWTAAAFAWSSGIRIWIGRGLHEARRTGEWPPAADHDEARRGNPLEALVTFAWLASLWTLMLSFALMLPANRRHDQSIIYTASAVFFAGVLSGKWVLVPLQRRLVAKHPGECWPESQSNLS
jgi:hypothetical protein